MAKSLQLADGRALSYIVSAAPDGIPLVFLHGTPGSNTIMAALETKCKSKGIKLITITRAGYGDSSRQQGRRVVDVVDDVQQLTKHLNITRCFVAGWSGGGPHALACAARLSGCMAVLSIAAVGPADADDLDFLSGQGESNIEEYQAAGRGEADLRAYCDAARPGMMGDANAIAEALASVLPDVDRAAILRDKDFSAYVAQSFQDSLKTNCDGWIDDDMAFLKAWGFDVGEIKVPVLLYQGSEDKMVPFSHGQWIAKHIPEEKLESHLLQGEGHISIFLDHADEMLDGLLKHSS